MTACDVHPAETLPVQRPKLQEPAAVNSTELYLSQSFYSDVYNFNSLKLHTFKSYSNLICIDSPLYKA